MGSRLTHYGPIARARAANRNNRQRRVVKAQKSAATAKDILSPLLSGETDHIFALTAGQASLIDFLLAAIDARPAKQISVWTWAIADYELLTMSDVCAAAKGLQFRLIIDRASVLRQPRFLLWFREHFGDDSIRVTVTHAKIATVEYGDGRVMTIRGSANLNNNPRCEQMDICTTTEVFSLVRDIEDELWRERPPLRAEDCEFARNNDTFEKIFGAVSSPEKVVRKDKVRMPLV